MKRLTSNFLVILGSDIARRLLGFITIAYLARRISVEDFGIINIAFAILSYAIMVSSGGLGAFGAREVARGAPTGFINALVSLRIVAALALYGIVSLVGLWC